ncbi:MAG: glycosyltransferase [Planctomycetota bacterium]
MPNTHPFSTIPPILHQTSLTVEVPKRWRHTVAASQEMHPGWRYELWTNDRARRYVADHHPELAETFNAYERDIMRADVIRYVVMHDLGGVYCDLDYEFLRPYDYRGADLVVAMEFARDYGDELDIVAGFFLASAPGHPFWADVLAELTERPPTTGSYHDVVDATGPGMLTRVFFANRHKYAGVRVEPRPAFSPFRMRGANERQVLLNSGVTYGIHHAWGSWRERWSATYFKTKIAQWVFGKREKPIGAGTPTPAGAVPTRRAA